MPIIATKYNGNLLTNANLDACHDRTSAVMRDGKPVSMYYYNATLEFSYTIGCFHGTSIVREANVASVTGTPGAPGPPDGNLPSR